MVKDFPAPPVLDLSAMSIGDLTLLADFFLHQSEAGLAIRNQPRCFGVAAEYIEDFQSFYINGLLDKVREALRSRIPLSQREAELRAECLVRHLSESDSLEEIAAIALSAVVQRRRWPGR